MDKNKIGKEIQKFRKAKGLSQEELAVAIGLNSKDIISKYERGERLPTLEKTLPKICKVLGIDYEMTFYAIQNNKED